VDIFIFTMATNERFWGLPVPVSASPVTVNLRGKCLHVTQIALVNPSPKPVKLEVSTASLGKARFTLATLSGANQQAVVDITFFEGDEKVTFFASGRDNASFHLTGVMVSEGNTTTEAKIKVEGTAAMIADDDSDEDDEDFDPEAAQNGHQGAEDDDDDDDDESEEADDDDDEGDDDDEDDEDDDAGDDDDSEDEDDSEDDDDDDDDDDDEEEEVEVVQKQRPQKKRKAEPFSTPVAAKKKSSSSSSKTPYTEKKSGLKIRVLKQGTGSKVKGGAKLEIHYTGKLKSENGKEFDSSKGGQPLAFRCGMKKVIKGFDEGVIGMKKGEIRELLIPPNLAYGTKGAGDVVPPNSTLHFEIQRV